MLIHISILNFQSDTHKSENPAGDCVSRRVGGLEEEEEGWGGEGKGMLAGHGVPHRHSVLPGEGGGLAQQLRLGHGDGAGRLPDQHRVVELGSSRGGRAQVPALGNTGTQHRQRCSASGL